MRSMLSKSGRCMLRLGACFFDVFGHRDMDIAVGLMLVESKSEIAVA